MTETLRQRIIVLLSRDIHRLFSISDISKALKSAYSHTNTYIKDLEKENIVKTIKIANAHICTLNVKEPLTRGYLSLIEYRKLKQYKNKQKKAKINLFLSRVKEKKIYLDSVFESRGNIVIMVPELENKLVKDISDANLGIDYAIYDRDRFAENQDGFIKNHVIFYGAEKFWENVKKNIKLE